MTDQIAPVLDRIKAKANWVKSDAEDLAFQVRQLSYQRSYETNAEAAIDDAEKAVIEALASVRKSRAAFQCKPVEV